MNLPRFLTRATSRRQVILRKHAKGFVWMCMYSSQFTCVKVDWNGIKPSFIPIHFNTHRLKYTYIQIRPKKDAKDVVVFFLKLGGKHRFVVSLHCSWASLQTTKQWAFSPRPSCVYPQPIALSVSSCSIVTMPCMHILCSVEKKGCRWWGARNERRVTVDGRNQKGRYYQQAVTWRPPRPAAPGGGWPAGQHAKGGARSCCPFWPHHSHLQRTTTRFGPPVLPRESINDDDDDCVLLFLVTSPIYRGFEHVWLLTSLERTLFVPNYKMF
jgi:hypothetical protein